MVLHFKGVQRGYQKLPGLDRGRRGMVGGCNSSHSTWEQKAWFFSTRPNPLYTLNTEGGGQIARRGLFSIYPAANFDHEWVEIYSDK